MTGIQSLGERAGGRDAAFSLRRRVVPCASMSIPFLMMLVGCGHKSNSSPAAAAQGVASDGRPPVQEKLVCPPSLQISPRPAAAPVDDIRGLRLGTTLDQAILFIRCLDPKANYTITTNSNGISLDYYGRTIRTGTVLTTGRMPNDPKWASATGLLIPTEERSYLGGGRAYSVSVSPINFAFVTQKFTLTSLGESNQEVVYGIEQTQFFPEGQMPTAAQIAKDLQDKYGAPQAMNESRSNADLTWKYDFHGRGMSQSDPSFRICSFSSGSWSSACGLTLGASITKLPTNELLVSSFSVGVVNQAQLVAAIEQTGDRWKAADEQRKLDEMKKANSAAPARL